jgi:hypothetical protein
MGVLALGGGRRAGSWVVWVLGCLGAGLSGFWVVWVLGAGGLMKSKTTEFAEISQRTQRVRRQASGFRRDRTLQHVSVR